MTSAKKYLLEYGKLILTDGKIIEGALCVFINNSPDVRRNVAPYTMVFLVGDKRCLIHFDKIKLFKVKPRVIKGRQDE